MKSMMHVDYSHREVIWRMDADKARALAEFLADNTPEKDIAQLDAVDLRMMAARVDPFPTEEEE